ncbi:MAG TPA: hypothetical protein VMD59_24740, partial [Acidimicrobiales bacterium]|nr:hypothetical protein [Acidimicrobiales bacterium]
PPGPLAGPGLVFVGERDCRVEEAELDTSSLAPGQVVLELEISVVSAGTEVANFTGLDPRTRIAGSWNTYPHRPGYGAVGTVVAVGPPAPGLDPSIAVGERAFGICRHARYALCDATKRPIVPLLAGDDARTMVLARMASVSITALRKAAGVELGATAAVVGLGLVGNFAAQLLRLSGMTVLGIDVVEERVEMARRSGLRAALVEPPGAPPPGAGAGPPASPPGAGEPSELAAAESRGAASAREVVESELGGAADLVVEASGVPDAVMTAVSLAREGADVVLLGSPRGAFHSDVAELLYEIHHSGIRLVGALEWLLPLRGAPRQSRWSLCEDYVTIFDLIRRGELRTAGLVTDVVPPGRAQEMYTRLADRDPAIGAVLFDWR